ncbi:hypothetical protein Naga_100630g2 [Nannochloropsis gaditana]|uniref:Uncharacterized protein n=1 Tax=Nannochloropsis gaditana TaxID=72520 RepID=W7T3G7_9STRA|nr:hypothetical protein Naga_100630g2 [Nannochloropsis gaditana]
MCKQNNNTIDPAGPKLIYEARYCALGLFEKEKSYRADDFHVFFSVLYCLPGGLTARRGTRAGRASFIVSEVFHFAVICDKQVLP